MIMISKMRDKINPRKKRLNLEEAKGQKVKKSFGPDFIYFMVENEPTSYRKAVTSSECTTALNVVPWETEGESVLREACPTCASFHDLLLFSYLSFILSEVAASEFSHLNHSLSHRPVSVKPDISKPDISKASSAGERGDPKIRHSGLQFRPPHHDFSLMDILPGKLTSYILDSWYSLGPKQLGNGIDVYLAPLIDDLKTLWDKGVKVYDAYKKENFTLRAMIFCTISDFLAYENLSGYGTKVIDPEVLDSWQSDIILMLCELEMYFPPSFFDIMVYLVLTETHPNACRQPQQAAALSWLLRCKETWPQQPLLGLLRRTHCPRVATFKDLEEKETTTVVINPLLGRMAEKQKMKECRPSTQVFYVKDPSKSRWHIIFHGKRRILGVENVVDEDEYDKFNELPPFTNGVPSLDGDTMETTYLRSDHNKGLWVS
ncbi:reverse transcriptase domain-containing protein [Tanacetum coccineum]